MSKTSNSIAKLRKQARKLARESPEIYAAYANDLKYIDQITPGDMKLAQAHAKKVLAEGPTGSTTKPCIELATRNNKLDECGALAMNEVKSDEEAAKAAGMLLDDFQAIREVCIQKNVTISFRDTNPACLPHLAAGVESKGHDTLTKTFAEKNLSGEENKKLAGLVSKLREKPGDGHIINNPKELLIEPNLTGDYDIMDMIDNNAPQGGRKRIDGESEKDNLIREAINANLPLRPPPPPHPVERIKHGAQAEYRNYLEKHPEEKPIPALFKPEAPLTVFDGKEGKVFRLKTLEDVFDFYACRKIEIPEDWEVLRDGKSVPTEPLRN